MSDENKTQDVTFQYETPQNSNRDAITRKTLKPKRKLSKGKIASLIVIILCVGFIGSLSFFGYNVVSIGNKVTGQGADTNFWSQIGGLFSSLNPLDRTPVKGESEGRTNVLILGKDSTGKGLTDTIILASYYHKEQKAVMVNIPRDFYIASEYGSFKINSLFSFSDGGKDGSTPGEQIVADFLSKEFDIPVHYWASVNWAAFEEGIDALGGIEVDVTERLVDCQYPNPNYRGVMFPCPTFEKGLQQMNGARALIYSRSRSTTSDFDRSRRQMDVIVAAAKKAKALGIADNVSQIPTYLSIIGNNAQTSATLEEISSGARLGKDIQLDNSYYSVVWRTGNGFLCDGGSTDGAYIITYCGGAIAGGRGTSNSRTVAKNQIQNLLSFAQSAELFESKVVVIGNLSNDTTTFANDLFALGFKNVVTINNYREIQRATATSNERSEVIIVDSVLREKYNKLEKKPDVDQVVLSDIPSDYIIPPAHKEADVIVWVSST